MHIPKIQSQNRAAVALNNIGVSLLERNEFEEAMATFRDAVHVLKIGFVSATKGLQVESTTANDTYKIEQILGTATKRLLRAPSCATTEHRLPSIQLVTRSLLDLPAAAKVAIDEGPTSSQAFIIRVDDLDVDIELYLESDLKSAITLHNFAVSYLCMSHATPNKKKQDKLIKGAIKVFAASHAILIARQRYCLDADSSNMLHSMEALVLSNLVQLSSTCCDRTTATAFYDRFVVLRDIFYGELRDYCQPQRIRTAAAA